MKRLLSQNNKKLGRIASFSLPTNVCCAKYVKAQGCGKYCYAKRLERLRPVMVAKYQWNFVQSKRNDFVEVMNDELKFVGDIVRIHSSGDFYSQHYFDKWCEIAKANKHKIFYGYTKNLNINFSKRPRNMKILFSDDKEIFPYVHSLFDGVSRVQKVPKEEKGWTICSGFCEDCRICWQNKNPKITFKLK